MAFKVSTVSRTIPFDNTGTSLTSTDMQGAIEEISAASSGGFSRPVVNASQQLTIPVDQQMIVKRQMKVRGELIIRGELVII
jgi:hypothetical protein